jgi:hypothetical protein
MGIVQVVGLVVGAVGAGLVVAIVWAAMRVVRGMQEAREADKGQRKPQARQPAPTPPSSAPAPQRVGRESREAQPSEPPQYPVFPSAAERPRKAAKKEAAQAGPVSLCFVTSNGPLPVVLSPTAPCYVGRGTNNGIVITKKMLGWESVSRRHACIYFDKQRGSWIVKDESSRNGIYVDGRRTAQNKLLPGTRIRFGSVEAEFRVTVNA